MQPCPLAYIRLLNQDTTEVLSEEIIYVKSAATLFTSKPEIPKTDINWDFYHVGFLLTLRVNVENSPFRWHSTQIFLTSGSFAAR